MSNMYSIRYTYRKKNGETFSHTAYRSAKDILCCLNQFNTEIGGDESVTILQVNFLGALLDKDRNIINWPLPNE
jgi:hypothetical protein